MPRILTPLIAAVRGLDNLAATPGLAAYVHARFGSAEECRKLILGDFFRHAFDGSGADNYYDAGSCIDGRLTSAWNWCSKLEKKPYVRRLHRGVRVTAVRLAHRAPLATASATPVSLERRLSRFVPWQFHVFMMTGFRGFDGNFQT